MIRIQVSLDQEAYREAKAEARRQGIPLAEFLRRAVRLALPARGRAARPWMQYAGAVASGDPDASQNVDAVVYGCGREGRSGLSRLFSDPPRRWHTSLAVVSETYGWFLNRLGEDAARTFRLALTELPRFQTAFAHSGAPCDRWPEAGACAGQPLDPVTMRAIPARDTIPACPHWSPLLEGTRRL
jgi:hypothetical protein